MKIRQNESVIHDWIAELPFQQQALLMTGMRGPDIHKNIILQKLLLGIYVALF